MIARVGIQEWRTLPLGERVPVALNPCTIALDGEREFSVRPGERAEVGVADNGPLVVLLDEALRDATARGVFGSNHS
jgi:hypothetical protein